MKNTTKRVWSILLTICMLMGLMTVSAFADGDITIVSQPKDVKAKFGEKVSFTVKAEGENLTYSWFNWAGYPMEPEEFEGVDTDTLTIKNASCLYNDIYFVCEISDGESMVTSYGALLTVRGHGEASQYAYDEKSHMEICGECGILNNKNAHNWGANDTCKVCGYNEDAPIQAPILISPPEYALAYPGDDLQFITKAYGVGLTYQWYRCNSMDDERVALVDGANVSGAKTRKLTVKNVDCKADAYYYACVVSNDAGSVSSEASCGIYSTRNALPLDAFNHQYVCEGCDEVYGEDYHYDDDGDGVCDDCEYAFAANAPKITAQPQDVKVKNGHAPVTFKVAATGNDLSYQWYRWGESLEDDEKFSGTDTATLTIKSTYDKEIGEYDCSWQFSVYCVISNANGAVQSDYALYDVEHEKIASNIEWDSLVHDQYCVCGSWVDEEKHIDADQNKECDLCYAEIVTPFADASDSDLWYYDAALYGKTEGFFKGEYGKFLPEDNITRGEMVTVLARIAYGQDYIDDMNDYEFEEFLTDLAEENNTTAVAFKDIKGTFYERHARILSALGVVNGYEDGAFRGESDITREELAAILVRFIDLVYMPGMSFEEPVESFNDEAKISDWAVEVVDQARELGIFLGDENGNFNPTTTATRAETAQTLMRMGMHEGYLLRGMM